MTTCAASVCSDVSFKITRVVACALRPSELEKREPSTGAFNQRLHTRKPVCVPAPTAARMCAARGRPNSGGTGTPGGGCGGEGREKDPCNWPLTLPLPGTPATPQPPREQALPSLPPHLSPTSSSLLLHGLRVASAVFGSRRRCRFTSLPQDLEGSNLHIVKTFPPALHPSVRQRENKYRFVGSLEYL